VTDHRIGLTLYQLDSVMQGHLHTVIDAVTTYYQTEKLKQEAGNDHSNGAGAGNKPS